MKWQNKREELDRTFLAGSQRCTEMSDEEKYRVIVRLLERRIDEILQFIVQGEALCDMRQIDKTTLRNTKREIKMATTELHLSRRELAVIREFVLGSAIAHIRKGHRKHVIQSLKKIMKRGGKSNNTKDTEMKLRLLSEVDKSEHSASSASKISSHSDDLHNSLSSTSIRLMQESMGGGVSSLSPPILSPIRGLTDSFSAQRLASPANRFKSPPSSPSKSRGGFNAIATPTVTRRPEGYEVAPSYDAYDTMVVEDEYDDIDDGGDALRVELVRTSSPAVHKYQMNKLRDELSKARYEHGIGVIDGGKRASTPKSPMNHRSQFTKSTYHYGSTDSRSPWATRPGHHMEGPDSKHNAHDRMRFKTIQRLKRMASNPFIGDNVKSTVDATNRSYSRVDFVGFITSGTLRGKLSALRDSRFLLTDLKRKYAESHSGYDKLKRVESRESWSPQARPSSAATLPPVHDNLKVEIMARPATANDNNRKEELSAIETLTELLTQCALAETHIAQLQGAGKSKGVYTIRTRLSDLAVVDVNLAKVGVTDRECSAVLVALSVLRVTRHGRMSLLLRNNALSDRAASFISTFLVHHPFVNRVDLRNNRVSVIGAAHLLNTVKVLRAHRQAGVTRCNLPPFVLSLQGNMLTRQTALAILQDLSLTNGVDVEIDEGGEYLSQEDVEMLLAIKFAPIVKVNGVEERVVSSQSHVTAQRPSTAPSAMGNEGGGGPARVSTIAEMPETTKAITTGHNHSCKSITIPNLEAQVDASHSTGDAVVSSPSGGKRSSLQAKRLSLSMAPIVTDDKILEEIAF